MASGKKISQSRKSRLTTTKAEVVYKVSKKPKNTPKKSLKSPSAPPTHFFTPLYTYKLSKKQLIITLSIVLIVALSIVGVSGYRMIIAIYNANESSQPIETDINTKQRIQLMGNANNYPNEIINYSTAPNDLRDFILSDYKKLKASCIVNGERIGTAQYVVMQVEDNTFAKISKGCNGTETIILAKVSDNWTVIFTGNDLPKCAEVYAYNVPRGIVPNCVTGNNSYTNPIP